MMLSWKNQSGDWKVWRRTWPMYYRYFETDQGGGRARTFLSFLGGWGCAGFVLRLGGRTWFGLSDEQGWCASVFPGVPWKLWSLENKERHKNTGVKGGVCDFSLR